MPARRRRTETNANDESSLPTLLNQLHNDLQSLSSAISNPFADVLTEEEYQTALRAEREFLERQQQIQGDQAVARQLLNASSTINGVPLASVNPSGLGSSRPDTARMILTASRPNLTPTRHGFQLASTLANSTPLFTLMHFYGSNQADSDADDSSNKPKPTKMPRYDMKPVPYDGSPCSICFEDVPEKPVACVSCKQCIGCEKCIKSWAKAGKSKMHHQCPLCRFDWRSSKPKVVDMIISEAVQNAETVSLTPNASTSKAEAPVRRKRAYTRRVKQETEQNVENEQTSRVPRLRRRQV